MMHRCKISVKLKVFILIFACTTAINTAAQENDKVPLEDSVTSLPGDKTAEESQRSSQIIADSVTKWPDNFFWRTVTTGAGSYPFTYFFTNLLFDLVRYGISGFDDGYAPWPFKNQNSVTISNNEKMARIGTALGLSISIGLLDSIFSKP